MESQNKRIRTYLESGRSLTALDGLHLVNCFRLGARIYDLKREGMNISTEIIEIISDGRKKHIARYKLVK
jgi:hypothetical protein